MKHISVMLKPASSLCNLRCRYCFYAEVSDSRAIRSFGVMERETASRILANIFSCLDPGDEVNLAFQGGEPTLAGLDFFRFFVSEVERLRGKLRVGCALQTNGTLLDEDWCAFFREHDFLIGLSLDATQAMHDQNRVDSSGKAIELTRQNVAMNFPADPRHEAFCEDAFKYLDKAADYNLIILDPPAFAKHRGALHNALKGYTRLNQKAFEKMERGGILFTFSCSQVVTKDHFRNAVFTAAALAHRKVRILHQLHQPADHPINIYHPEGEYLKGLVLYVE